MGTSFKVDMSWFKKLVIGFDNPAIKQKFSEIPQDKAIAGLIGQAIADNFAKQGPGWPALKAATVRYSVSKSIKKDIEKQVLSSMGLGKRPKHGKGWSRQLQSEVKANIEKHIASHEHQAKSQGTEPYRMILQRTGLLKKTATIPGFAGSNKKVSGGNIYKVEGNNIIWGTDLKYAAIHNEGLKGMPKREFLVLRQEWKKKITEYAFKKYKTIIKNMFVRI